MKERKWEQTFAYCRIMSRLSLGLNYLSWLTLLFNRSTTFFSPKLSGKPSFESKKDSSSILILEAGHHVDVGTFIIFTPTNRPRAVICTLFIGVPIKCTIVQFSIKDPREFAQAKESRGKMFVFREEIFLLQVFAGKYFSSKFLPEDIFDNFLPRDICDRQLHWSLVSEWKCDGGRRGGGGLMQNLKQKNWNQGSENWNWTFIKEI